MRNSGGVVCPKCNGRSLVYRTNKSVVGKTHRLRRCEVCGHQGRTVEEFVGLPFKPPSESGDGEQGQQEL